MKLLWTAVFLFKNGKFGLRQSHVDSRHHWCLINWWFLAYFSVASTIFCFIYANDWQSAMKIAGTAITWYGQPLLVELAPFCTVVIFNMVWCETVSLPMHKCTERGVTESQATAPNNWRAFDLSRQNCRLIAINSYWMPSWRISFT